MNRDLLIVGNAYDRHLERFIRALRVQGAQYSIDIFDISMRYGDIPSTSLYDNAYMVRRHFPGFMYKIGGLSKIAKYFDVRESFKELKQNYKIINIQVVTIQSYILLKLLKKSSIYLITTPWGSDVYRITDSMRKKYQKVYDASEYVCVMPNTKFGDDIIDIFNVSKEKCLELCFGSDVLDRVMVDKIPKDEAKKKMFGTNDNFVITCGYNAASAQNHLHIVDALGQIKEQLPSNTLLVFPLTYAKKAKYLVELEKKVKATGINYKFLTTYLSDQEMIWLRKGTDLFIHMQQTDAYSSSLHEYLYSKTKVINAEWLSYKELETWGLPYKFSTFETLSNDVIAVLNNSDEWVSEDLRKYLIVYSWSYQINEWNKTFEKLLKL